MLRQKEWTLLLRDPWLVSQTLMQLLYLLPPALLLWRSYGEGTGALVVLVPVLVMAAGQLAGGLAWLAISGEDAPDLVATAPVLARSIVRAKIEAVLGGIAIAFAPFIAALAFLSALARARRGARHLRGRRCRDRHPVLVPQAGDAALFPPPPDRLALCDLRGGVLVDLVGRDRRARGGRHLARAVSRPRSGSASWSAARWMSPHKSIMKMAGLSPGHFSLVCLSGSPGHAALARGGPVMRRFGRQLPRRSPLMTGPNSSQRSPLNFCICICSIG